MGLHILFSKSSQHDKPHPTMEEREKKEQKKANKLARAAVAGTPREPLVCADAKQPPKIAKLEWGRMVLEDPTTGTQKEFKDCKVWPGGAKEWDWGLTQTRHTPGIQPADLEELLDGTASADIEVFVLSKGTLPYHTLYHIHSLSRSPPSHSPHSHSHSLARSNSLSHILHSHVLTHPLSSIYSSTHSLTVPSLASKIPTAKATTNSHPHSPRYAAGIEDMRRDAAAAKGKGH